MAEQKENLNNRSIELCRRVVTTGSFIREAKEIYGNRYNYSKVEYKNKDHKVIVTCPIHGDFHIYAREHLDGKGCPKCEKGEKFIAKLKGKFDQKFGLDKFVYESSTSPITLICPVHGAFSRLPHQILNSKCGCPECGNDLQRQLQEQTHQDALEHKEERELARKEREYARREAKRQREEEKKRAEEAQAKEKWIEKIQSILEYKNRRIIDSKLDQLADYPNKFWYKNFFGLNLNAILNENGALLDGEQYLSLRPRHWPLRQMKVEASKGELIEARIYVCNLNKEQTIELLLILEDIICGGYKGSIKDINEKFEPCLNQTFKYEGIRDGYKIVFNQWTFDATIKIRKIGAKTKRVINYHKYDVSTLPTSFVAIDFETLYPQRVSACSVGMVKYIDGKIVDSFYTLIRPPFDYPGKCGGVLTWVHGLTEEMVKNERTFKEVLPEMERFVDGLPLVAHNACVERACIRDASAYYGIETTIDFENIFDTLPLSRQAEAKLGISEEGLGTHQLDTVCKRFGISGNNHHNALADAEMSGNLMVVFQKVLNDGVAIGVVETTTSNHKYNPEDKVQRTDLDSVADNPFKNQVVVLTGFIKADSQEYAHKLNELGAIIKESVNRKTNILITEYNAGPSKMQKAREFGARIMSEEEFKEIINQL